MHRPHEDYPREDRDRLWQQVFAEVEAFRSQHPGVEVKRGAIELAVDQADGLPTMIGERVTQMAADKTVEEKSPESANEPEQRLYF